MSRRVSDRDERLIRARARLGVVVEILSRAEHDVWAIRPDLGKVVNDRCGSLEWVVQELGRELRKDPENQGEDG